MAMIKCGECGKEKSTKAEICPHCGVKSPKKTSAFTWIVLIIFILIYANWPDMEKSETKNIELTIKQKQQKEKALLAELKKIPASELYSNMLKYKELFKMFPSNNKYIKKYYYYKDKVDSLELKIGKKPTVSAWDGVPYSVENYIKTVAKDPDSVDFEGCTNTRFSNEGWSTTCKIRANNSFGGKVLELWEFTIKHNNVIDAVKI